MSADPDFTGLLDDVLSESETSAFREELLARTLKEVRRHQVVRRARHCALALGACLSLGALAWLAIRPDAVVRVVPVPQSRTALVETQALPPDHIVHTSGAGFDLRALSEGSVVLVRTGPGGYRPIDDEELLRLLAPRPAVLIGVGSHLEILVLGSDVDRNTKPLN